LELSYYNAWKVCLSVCLSVYLSVTFCVPRSWTLTAVFESLDLRYVRPHLAPMGSLRGVEMPGKGVDPPIGWKLC